MCTHQAHYVYTSGTQQAQYFENILKKLVMCLLCAACVHIITCGASRMLNTEKYGQFPFQRWHKRQNRTFLAPCGSAYFLAKNHRFDEKSRILARMAENRDFLLYARKLSYSGNGEKLEGARTTVGKL